jgi:hypothetical protein
MTDATRVSDITRAFEAQAIDNSRFHHADHVRVAYDLLGKYDFIDAAAIYARGIKALAAKAGAPRKFNLTITYAFMSLIAERMASDPRQNFDDFVSANADIMSKDVLAKWYRDERLHSDTARTMFLLPDVA